MKPFRFLLVFISFILGLNITKGQIISKIGDFKQEELDMKVCAFDEEADAVYLLEEAVANYDSEYQLVTTYRVRIKILNERALDLANIHIPYYSHDKFEFIRRVDGMVITPRPNQQPEYGYLDKKTVFSKKVDDYYSEMVFSLPNVQVGSILDYTFESVMKHYGGLDDWKFQKNYPVACSKFYLFILPRIEFNYRILKSSGISVDVKQNSELGSVSFEMRNIPGLSREPYMDSRKDYLQRVEFQLAKNSYGQEYMESWDALSKEFWQSKEFGKQLTEKISGINEVLEPIRKIQDPVQRMRAVYLYLRKNLNWTGMSSKYSSNGVKKTWAERTGHSADLNLLLINVLNSVGLPAKPLLVSERHHGKVHKVTPFAGQFNTVYAYLSMNGRSYYLDLTNSHIDPELIPFDILNTTGFIVGKSEGEFVDIKSVKKYAVTSNLSLKIEGNMIQGAGFQSCQNYAKWERLRPLEKGMESYQKEYFNLGENTKIDSFDVTNTSPDSLPLIHRYQFTMPATGTGDYLFIPLKSFLGFENENPFISRKRLTHVNFGFGQAYTARISIAMPKGYVLEDIKKSLAFVTPDKQIRFNRVVAVSASGDVQVMIDLEFSKTLFTPEEYPDLQAIYKEIFAALDEPIVLKKL